MTEHSSGMIPIKQVLEERGQWYGDFYTGARTSQNLKRALHNAVNWDKLPQDHQEALEQIAHKMSRIVNGGTFHADTWLDIIGYATLILEIGKEMNNG